MRKNAWVAAVLNFIIPGLGYIYAGYKRLFYGWALLILSFVILYNDWDDFMGVLLRHEKPSLDFMLMFVLYPLVFAWDAYRDVVESKSGK